MEQETWVKELCGAELVYIFLSAWAPVKKVFAKPKKNSVYFPYVFQLQGVSQLAFFEELLRVFGN